MDNNRGRCNAYRRRWTLAKTISKSIWPVKVPVLILYVTAVAEEDGSVHFFDDIYGHDRRLNALLSKGPPYP